MTKSLLGRINDGIEFLEERYGPDWYRLLDPDKLQMDATCQCVFGQLEGDYDEACLSFGLSNDDACDLGFNAYVSESYVDDPWNLYSGPRDLTYTEECATLTAIWRAVIMEAQRKDYWNA